MENEHKKSKFRMRPWVLIAFFVFLLLAQGFGQRQILGGYSGVLDRMGAGIAELGAGNTGTARENSAPAAYWNPAVLAFPKGKMLGTGADIRSLNRNGGMACIQGKIAPKMGLGLGLVNRGDFNVKVYDEDENALGTARPQDFGIYVGVGIKTSRKTGYGASVQWLQSSKDIGGTGDYFTVGILNFGWYRIWSKQLKTALVLRNIGLNADLSAEYFFDTRGFENHPGNSEDYIPKTLVAALGYSFQFYNQDFDAYLELIDYQLSYVIFDAEPDRHVLAMRTGLEWRLKDVYVIRTGVDRGNITFGLGYSWKVRKRNKLSLDYALVLERGGLTFNPFGFGMRYEM